MDTIFFFKLSLWNKIKFKNLKKNSDFDVRSTSSSNPPRVQYYRVIGQCSPRAQLEEALLLPFRHKDNFLSKKKNSVLLFWVRCF